jgi:2-hydroxychromene-2-carboxylate isomerase
MRAAVGLQQTKSARFDEFVAAVFHAMWVEPRNLGDPSVLAAVLTEAGFDPSELVELAGRQEVKDALKANTEEAVRRGAFGAPTMFVDGQMYFGQDRLDFVREALAPG